MSDYGLRGLPFCTSAIDRCMDFEVEVTRKVFTVPTQRDSLPQSMQDLF